MNRITKLFMFVAMSLLAAACSIVNEPPDSFGNSWQEITSEHVTFQVPGHWQPTAVTPAMGSVLAEWHLGIPDVESDQTLAFFAVPLADLKPGDLISEEPVAIGGQHGLKWVRGDETYTSYDYYTAGTEGTKALGAGSFGLHVTIEEADPELESILDAVAASVNFNR